MYCSICETLDTFYTTQINIKNPCVTFKMLVIELLNLINVVGNIFFLDAFLGGEFSAYGIEVCSTVYTIQASNKMAWVSYTVL